MTDTIEGYCRLFTADPVGVVEAAQRFGMHVVDDKQMAVTFTPRDRSFSSGVAVRKWRTDTLSGIDLEVGPSVKLPFSTMQDAFGPFKALARTHPGDDYEFLSNWRINESQPACRILVTLRARTARPTGREPVRRISISR